MLPGVPEWQITVLRLRGTVHLVKEAYLICHKGGAISIHLKSNGTGVLVFEILEVKEKVSILFNDGS